MKLALVSLLLPFFAVAASSSLKEAESFDEDDEYVNLPNLPLVEVWDCVNPEIKVPESDEIEIEISSFNWSLSSFFGSLFSPSSPLKQATPPPVFLGSAGDDNLELMSSVINCDIESLRIYDISIIERVIALKNIPTKTKILSHIANIGVKSLFELFVDSNISFILSEITFLHDFTSVAHDCIKIDSINSLVNIMFNLKFRLNAPHAVVVASMNGSHEVLKFILAQQKNPDYAWEWKSFDGGDGYIFDFGTDPYSAALFLGSLKAISANHLDCLQILVSKGLNVSFNNCMLLKKTTSIQGSEGFEIIYHASCNISTSLMNEILRLAICNSNDTLVEYLLSLDYNYSIDVRTHLISAINSNNTKLFNIILAQIDPTKLYGQILSLVASSGNVDNFIALLKISSKDLIISAICSCITNESLVHFVPHIVDEITLTSEIVAQALLHSTKSRSLPLVKLFLSHAACDIRIFSPPFIEALITNDIDIVNDFFYKFSADSLIRHNLISKTVTKLFEIEAWNSMKVFVQNYFEFDDFPKRKFITRIILTDQVEIARVASDKGATFPPSELYKIRHDGMRTFVMERIRIENLSKSQTKCRT